MSTTLDSTEIIRPLRPAQLPALAEQHADVDAGDRDTNKQANHHRRQQQRHQRMRPLDDDGIHAERPLEGMPRPRI